MVYRLRKSLRKLHRRLALVGPGRSRTLYIGGRAFRAPKINGSLCQITEPWMVQVLAAILPLKPGLFLDVGVNLGQTLLAVKAVDPDRHYIGIEPNPLCISYVDALIEANDIRETELIAAGLGDETGLRRLYFYNDSTTGPGATFIKDFRPDQPVTGARVLPIATYDEVRRAGDIGTLSIVKIDVEGGEAAVMASLKRALSTDRPWILIEVLPCYGRPEYAARLTAQTAIEAAFHDLGYEKLRIRKKAQDETFLCLEPVASIGVHSDIALSDYLCVPSADAQTVTAALGRCSPK